MHTLLKNLILTEIHNKIEEESIITIYKTGVGTLNLFRKFGIDMINAKMIDETTIRLESG